MSSKTRQFLIHILACAAFLSLPFLFAPEGTELSRFFQGPNTRRDFIGYLLTVLFFYLNYLVLIPRLYFRKKYFLYFLFVLGCFFLIVWLPTVLVGGGHLGERGFGPAPGPPRPPTFSPDVSHNLLRFLLAFFLSILVKINIRLRHTEQEKMNAELSFLRAQINPHFLFNTLNSIYSLAIEKSDDTAEAVVKLSGMMRYVTSEASRDFVPLEKELDYIRNYIELQQIRFGDTVQLAFSIEGASGGKQIAPLVLIPFVENAFKYGVNPEEDSDIKIAIRILPKDLELKVLNNKVIVRPSKEEATGLGITNTRERLHLLYPGKHDLQIEETKEQFSVSLTLRLE